MHPLAVAGAVVGRLTHYALSGTAGVLVLRGVAKAAPKAKPAARRLLVSGIAGGITTGRRLGAATEEARLKAGDLLAEARERLGEEAPPPSAVGTEGHTHDHDHEHDHEHQRARALRGGRHVRHVRTRRRTRTRAPYPAPARPAPA